MYKKLILASASPRRKELLEQVGAEFLVLPAKGQEIITKEAPQDVVMELALQKAREVADCCETEDAIILGADTVVAYEGHILGKPKDEADAVRMLTMLSGKEHQVFTGVAFVVKENGRKREHSFCEMTEVSMYPMSDEEIRAYVDTKEPMDKAGSYGIQGKCAIHIRKINGDYNNVVGLPVARVYQEIREMGIDFFSGS